MDFRELLSVVWRRRLLVVLVVLLCAGSGAYFALTKQPTYESRVTIAITPDIARQGFIASDNLSALLGTYAETVKSQTVRDKAEQEIGGPLKAEITSTTEQGTGILRIFARSSSPEAAARAAGAVAHGFVGTLADDTFITSDVVDPADVPTDPVQPRPPLIIGTSILVGFGAAVLLALLLDRFRRRVETSADLAGVPGLALVGQVPRSRGLARSQARIVWEEPSWVDLQESFRTLRTNVSFITGGGRQTLQVTSGSEAQGKSTIVANLGVAFAQIGVRTAILDADLRRPAQHEIFNIPNRGRVWAENPRLDTVGLGRTRFENLSVFTAGQALTDPTTVLHTRIPALINALGEQFDLVLIDSPPVGPVSDALIISPWVDGLLFVISAGQERPASIRRALADVAISGVELKGYVLNQAPEAPEAGGYYRRPDQLIADEPPDVGAVEVAAAHAESLARDR